MLHVIAAVQVTAPNGSASAGALLPGLGANGELQGAGFPEKSGNASWTPGFVKKVRVTNNLTAAGPMYVRFGTTSAVAATINDAVININNPVLFTLNENQNYFSVFGSGASQTAQIELVTGDME